MTAIGGEDDALAHSARLAPSVPHSAFRREGASSVAGPGVRAVPLGQLADALQENPKEEGEDNGKDEGRGNGKGKGEEAAKKVTELERKVDELIGKGKIRPPATTQIQGAVAQLALALQQAG